MEIAVNTNSQMRVNEEEGKISFSGREDQFRRFCDQIDESRLNNAKELEISLQPSENTDDVGMQEKMCSCFCCLSCYECCPGFMCCLNCILFIFFYWIILPIYCCILICSAQNIADALIAAMSLKDMTYRKLVGLGSRTRVNKIKLTVLDMNVDAIKVDHLRRMIKKSGASQFEFKNTGEIGKVDPHKPQNVATFESHIGEVTRIPGLKYNIQWGRLQLNN